MKVVAIRIVGQGLVPRRGIPVIVGVRVRSGPMAVKEEFDGWVGSKFTEV